jgi:hypothetical protein
MTSVRKGAIPDTQRQNQAAPRQVESWRSTQTTAPPKGDENTEEALDIALSIRHLAGVLKRARKRIVRFEYPQGRLVSLLLLRPMTL